MQPHTTTSGARTSHPGVTESTSSQAVFHANRFLKLANDRELPTTATCGLKCIEQYEKSDRAGLWGKTFSAFLIGMEGWFSRRCALTWKLKVTPSNRLYFQLAASTPRINVTGHGLLPTVTTTNSRQGFNSTNGTGKPLLPMATLMLGTPTALAKPRSKKFLAGANRIPNPAEFARMVESGLLPTPTAFDRKTCHQEVTGKTITRNSGEAFTAGLRMLAPSGFLPTPNAAEATKFAKTHNPNSPIGKGMPAFAVNPAGLSMLSQKEREQIEAMMKEPGFLLRMDHGLFPTPTSTDWKRSGMSAPARENYIAKKHQRDVNMAIYQKTGSTSQLNPLFVEEMMGFPLYWTALPFLSGAPSQLKPTAMQ